jgi:hypothetical protein
MGIAQSPLPALLLIASATLLKRDTDEQSTWQAVLIVMQTGD